MTKQIDILLDRVNARIPTSVTPATRIEIHPAEWIELSNAFLGLRERLSAEPPAPQKVVLLIADYGYEGQQVAGVYADRALAEAEATRDRGKREKEWLIEEYEVRAQRTGAEP